MTQHEIIELAIKCGWDNPATNMTPLYEFAKLVAEKEREACALICDEHADDPVYCGEAIRARGQA
jgi:hypothetical protein